MNIQQHVKVKTKLKYYNQILCGKRADMQSRIHLPLMRSKKIKAPRNWFDGYLRLGILTITFLSYLMLLFSIGITHPHMHDIRQLIHAVIPVHLSFDASILTDIFLFLWGVTQALVMFYMEHKQERILGVTLDRIIQVSMGGKLVVSTLILFLTEMIFWILSIYTDNHYLMSADLLLQLVNIMAVFIVIHTKQKPLSVLGTCKTEAAKARKKWIQNKTSDIPKLLLFDLLSEKNLTTSLSIEDVKNTLKVAYTPSGNEKLERRFSYELYLTEKICEGFGDDIGIPGVIKFLFENDGLADEISQRAILFQLVRSKNNYSVEEIDKLLKHTVPKNESHYVWCCIWSIY